MSSKSKSIGRGNKNLGNEVGFSTRFEKGKSGNPGGRPSRTPITDAIWEATDLAVSELKIKSSDPAPVALAKRLYSDAIGGKTPAAAELIDRIEGTPRRAEPEPGASREVEIHIIYDDPYEEARARKLKLAKTIQELQSYPESLEDSEVGTESSSSTE